MPFRRERYPADWPAISLRICTRAGWRCEWCGAENGRPNPVTGSRVVLTVAHLGVARPDGTAGDEHDKMDTDQLTAILAQIESLDYQPNEAREHSPLAGFVFLTHRVKNSCKTRLKNT